MTKEDNIKILVLGPSKTGKTSICNVLGDLSEKKTRANRPTKGVRIVECVVYVPLLKDNGSQRVQIELWDCSSEYEKFQPALRQGADGFIFVYNQNTTEQKEVLMKMYNSFVIPDSSDSDCIVFFNECYSKADSKNLNENPLQGLDHAAIDLQNEEEFKKILGVFIQNLIQKQSSALYNRQKT